MKKIIITLFLVNVLNASYLSNKFSSLSKLLEKKGTLIPQCFPSAKKNTTRSIADEVVEARIAVGVFLMYQ